MSNSMAKLIKIVIDLCHFLFKLLPETLENALYVQFSSTIF